MVNQTITAGKVVYTRLSLAIIKRLRCDSVLAVCEPLGVTLNFTAWESLVSIWLYAHNSFEGTTRGTTPAVYSATSCVRKCSLYAEKLYPEVKK